MPTLFGVNVPYLRGDYGHDLAPSPRFPDWPVRFDPMEAYRPLIEARELGFRAVRMWLCENAEGLIVDPRGHVTGVSEQLLESIRVIQEAARLHGLFLYWTLLDANAWPREGDPITRSILADLDQAQRFAENVTRKIASVVDPEITIGLEIVNEPETSTHECMKEGEPISWEAIGRAIRVNVEAARAERELLLTAGTMHVFLPSLWKVEPGINAIDVHIYHPDGGLPSREDLAAYVGDDAIRDERLPIVGGELGIPKPPGPRAPDSLVNYVYNARDLGYAAAFLWQLDGDLVDRDEPSRPLSWLGREVRSALQRRPRR